MHTTNRPVFGRLGNKKEDLINLDNRYTFNDTFLLKDKYDRRR